MPVIRIGLAFLLLLPVTCHLSPVVWADGPGTSAATFLKLGFGSRPLGMGEAFVAVADDASALHYNPAGLALASPYRLGRPATNWDLMMAYALHIQDIRISQLGILRRPFGLAMTYLNLDGIERRDSETLNPVNTFGASDFALGASYAHDFGGLGLGVTAKLIQQTIDTFTARTLAMDFGSLYRLERWPVSFGASLGNIGGRIRFIDQASPLPVIFRIGAAAGMTPGFPALLSTQLDIPRDSSAIFRLGLEYAGFGPFSLRAGYMAAGSQQRDAVLGKALGGSPSGLSEFFGLFLGVGFRLRGGSLDYSLLPYGDLGSAHRFSMSLKF